MKPLKQHINESINDTNTKFKKNFDGSVSISQKDEFNGNSVDRIFIDTADSHEIKADVKHIKKLKKDDKLYYGDIILTRQSNNLVSMAQKDEFNGNKVSRIWLTLDQLKTEL